MSTQAVPPAERVEMGAVQWAICGIACIGFLFDTFILLVLTLIVQPALTELLGAKPGSAIFNHWIGMLFYIPAVAGGVFGLLGGYLIDRLGRKRVLLWSIVLPAIATFGTAYATTPIQLLVLRSLTFVGVSSNLSRPQRGWLSFFRRGNKEKRFWDTRRDFRPPAASS